MQHTKIISNSLIEVPRSFALITMKKLLGISLALVMLIGSVPLGFSEPLQVQLEQGIEIDQIQCDNPNHVLVQRTTEKLACVSERTAERMGWEIIETVNVQNIPVMPEKTIEENNPITEKTIEIVPKEKTSWIHSATDLSYMDLEKIPNPEGYWVPIENSDVFAQQFANAAGEEITTVKKYGTADYYTTNGRIDISPVFVKSSVWSSVNYKIYETESIKSESEQLPFINNFMNSMIFKLNGNTLALTESFLETCDGNDFHRFCQLDDKSSIRKTISDDSIIYTLEGESSWIKFKFFDGSYAHLDDQPSISIQFNGWTNHPELIQHPLDEKDANDIIREYILSTEYFNKLGSDGGKCEVQLDESVPLIPLVISGVPFYGSTMAHCTYDPRDTGHFDWPLILVDAWTGEYVFREFVGGQD